MITRTVYLNAEERLAEHNAILLMWKKFGCKPEREWEQFQIIPRILESALMPENLHAHVRKVLVNYINENGTSHIIRYKTCLVSKGVTEQEVFDHTIGKVQKKCDFCNFNHTLIITKNVNLLMHDNNFLILFTKHVN